MQRQGANFARDKTDPAWVVADPPLANHETPKYYEAVAPDARRSRGLIS